jgi:hypothetical protein
MLFVIAMDVLNRLFVKATDFGVLEPIPVPGVKHYCSMHADDVMLLPAPTGGELKQGRLQKF